MGWTIELLRPRQNSIPSRDLRAPRPPVCGAVSVTEVRIIEINRMRGTGVDLEDPRAVARLADPMPALAGLEGLVILDESKPSGIPVLGRDSKPA